MSPINRNVVKTDDLQLSLGVPRCVKSISKKFLSAEAHKTHFVADPRAFSSSSLHSQRVTSRYCMRVPAMARACFQNNWTEGKVAILRKRIRNENREKKPGKNSFSPYNSVVFPSNSDVNSEFKNNFFLKKINKPETTGRENRVVRLKLTSWNHENKLHFWLFFLRMKSECLLRLLRIVNDRKRILRKKYILSFISEFLN